jgi:xanthine dehydrogenase YagT iron-sulfur-binding subunit
VAARVRRRAARRLVFDDAVYRGDDEAHAHDVRAAAKVASVPRALSFPPAASAHRVGLENVSAAARRVEAARNATAHGALAGRSSYRNDTHGTLPLANRRARQCSNRKGAELMGAPRLAHETAPLAITINGEQKTLDVAPWTSLLDLLREKLKLTGVKKGCDHGQCGACTVLIDGRRYNSCLLLAVMQDGRAVTTIEGLAKGDALHPLQQAFITHDAFQCGYCTPGQILSGVALLEEGRAGSREEIREYMSGNICRCGAYTNIVDAIEEVAAQSRSSERRQEAAE